jgi:hypothetical protein
VVVGAARSAGHYRKSATPPDGYTLLYYGASTLINTSIASFGTGSASHLAGELACLPPSSRQRIPDRPTDHGGRFKVRGLLPRLVSRLM